MNEKNSIVTIAIASYNNKLYIERCVDSVLNQSYHFLEILIIDDGSTDGTLSYIDHYKSDERVLIIPKENGGLSSVRQLGLNLAKGEYICFIDADDYLSTEHVERMLKKMQMDNSDICLSSTRFEDSNGKLIEIVKTEESSNPICITTSALANSFSNFSSKYYLSDSWNKMYRVGFLRSTNVEFCMPRGLNGTDTLFNRILVLYQPIYSTIKEVCYIHVIYEKSAAHRKNKNLQESFSLITRHLVKNAEKLGIKSDLELAIITYYYSSLFVVFRDVYKENRGDDALIQKFNELFDSHKSNIIRCNLENADIKGIKSLTLKIFIILLKKHRSLLPIYISIYNKLLLVR